MKIVKDNIEVKIETPITKLKQDLSESVLDFSSISYLKGDKNILIQSFREVLNESINE